MDEEIKTQANDELAQALASVSDDAVADLASPTVASTAASAVDDDFSDFAQDPRQISRPEPVDQDSVYAPPVRREAPKPQPKSVQPEPIAPTSSPSNARLEDIKERALSELRPLMESIDIPAQEKYETYLMMLRASDDQSLIEPTFKAARMIEDDKLRAKALLDIVHEINYLGAKA